MCPCSSHIPSLFESNLDPPKGLIWNSYVQK
jgi:hypothetical protein